MTIDLTAPTFCLMRNTVYLYVWGPNAMSIHETEAGACRAAVTSVLKEWEQVQKPGTILTAFHELYQREEYIKAFEHFKATMEISGIRLFCGREVLAFEVGK